MNRKRTKTFLLLGVMIASLVLCSCSPVPATDPSETEPSSTRSLIDLTPDSESKEGSDSFYDDRVLVTLKPGFGGLNKAINFDDFAEAGIILEQDVDCNTDLKDKIVISSVDDLTYLQNPETIDNDDNYLQILSFNLKDKSKANILKLVERMRLVDGVLSAEPEYIYTIKDLTVSDGLYNEQWGIL